MLLDEATSALDAVSEELVQKALESATQGRTVLTIAHRLSTIRNAHNIVVLDEGHVVEQGSYRNLMMKDRGVFKELVKLQTFDSGASSLGIGEIELSDCDVVVDQKI